MRPLQDDEGVGHDQLTRSLTLPLPLPLTLTLTLTLTQVWDMRNYKCLQTIQDKESYRPIDQITALMYDPVRAQLLSASTTMRPWPMLKVANPNPNPHPHANPSPNPSPPPGASARDGGDGAGGRLTLTLPQSKPSP